MRVPTAATSGSPASGPSDPPPRPASPWLIGPAADLAFVFGVGGLFSLALFACWRAGSGFLVLAAVFAVLLDFPHVLWTTLRVGFDPAERALHGRRYVISLAVIGAAVGTLAATGRFIVVLGVFVAWQVLHVVKQHMGMVLLYAAKGGYRGSRRPAIVFLVAGCLAPVVFRLAHGLRLGYYAFDGKQLPFSEAHLPVPPIPRLVVWAAYAAMAAAAAWFAAGQFRRPPGARLPAPAMATIAVAVVFYNASYALVSDPYALILIATTFHSLQYHVVSWARNHGRFTGREAGCPLPGQRQLLLARLTCPKSVIPLGIALTAVGVALAEGEFVLAGAVPFTLVLHHFYLDGVLWKSARNPALAADLRISRG